MTKKAEPRPLQPIPIDTSDISSLWWDERTKISHMTDIHLDNAIMKLGRYGYDSDKDLQDRWAELLTQERNKRIKESLVTFTKGKTNE
jgi:hypothetical protein